MRQRPSPTPCLMSFVLAGMLALLMLSGCGYSVGQARSTAEGLTRVSLGEITNNTYQPELSEKLAAALVVAFHQRGVAIDPTASHTVTGSINEYRQQAASEKNNVTVRYNITLDGEFTLSSAEAARPLNVATNYVVTFGGEGALEGILADRERALEEALADLAVEIVAEVIYRK